MIRVTVDIEVKGHRRAGVNVTARFDPRTVHDVEGATFVGICLAINTYMRSHGAPDFDCLKRDWSAPR